MNDKQKAKEIIDYVMVACGCNQTQGKPYKDMIKEVEFFLNTD
jgi:hypothetical protein